MELPLRSGRSQETISKNIEELLREYKETGKIGSSRPEDLEEAEAAAIAYRKAEISRRLRS